MLDGDIYVVDSSQNAIFEFALGSNGNIPPKGYDLGQSNRTAQSGCHLNRNTVILKITRADKPSPLPPRIVCTQYQGALEVPPNRQVDLVFHDVVMIEADGSLRDIECWNIAGEEQV